MVMAEVTIHSDFRDKEEEIITASTFPPPICQEGLGPDLRFCCCCCCLILNFKPTFSLSSFMLINSLFSSSSLYAIRVISLTYLKLVIFLLANLIPACNLSSPAFLLMCSVYKLNEQDDDNTDLFYSFLNPEPVSFSIQGSNSCFLAHIQVPQETGKMIWYSHLFKSFPQLVNYPHSQRL